MKVRKKPIEVDAELWDGSPEALERILAMLPKKADAKFDLPNDGQYVDAGIGHVPAHGTLEIPTLEGTMTAQPGDWVVVGAVGEVYPCKPDAFAATFDFVGDDGVAHQLAAMRAVGDHTEPELEDHPPYELPDMLHGYTPEEAEAKRVAEYERLVSEGLSEGEARATVWPDEDAGTDESEAEPLKE